MASRDRQDVLLDSHSNRRDKDCVQDDLFCYSAGRWLWNEDVQFANRYVKFDIKALCDVAAKAVGPAASCSTITKLPEGNFNKSFLITMNDGRDVIAKVPNPNAGRPYFNTASEVATMDYARNVLGIPLPKVYTWSSRSDATPVGAEYIIMEKATGIQLSEVWDTMHSRKKYDIIKQLVGFDKSYSTADLPAYGSLYYSCDLHNSTAAIPLPAVSSSGNQTSFSIGPTNNRKYFDDGRGDLELDRGPWRSVEQYVTANVNREQRSITEIDAPPQTHGLFNGPGQYRPSTNLKLNVLQDYLKISIHALPKDNSTHTPTLWHPDLHTSNIFVDAVEQTRITCIIDWQATHAAPLFMQVRHPALLEFDGPVPEGLGLPPPPANHNQLNSEAQMELDRLRSAQSLYKLYEIELLEQHKSAGRALQNRNSLTTAMANLAGSIFTDGEPVLLGYLIKATEEWSTIVGVDSSGNPLLPCPISYTEDQKQQQREMEMKWKLGVVLMDNLIEDLGVYSGWNGLVNHRDYEAMRSKLLKCKEHFLQHMAQTPQEREQWLKAWPFTDPKRNGPAVVPR
ncbi:kinase subdomain-containing protein [Bisporella sp. PMI_857]|nr:kinase subdomain-containing protein [Bisporella sp. PMI_857]